MTLPVWPATLPPPLRNALGVQRLDGRRFREGEVMPPRMGRKSSSRARLIQLTLILDRQRLAILDQFYEHDLAGGTRPFWMPDPVWDGIALLDETGNPLLTDTDAPILSTRLMLCQWGYEPPVEGPLKGAEMPVSFSVWDMP
jgi:hypothetical protein